MTPGTASLTLVRQVRAPAASVFDALTRPALMLQWWCPDAGETLAVEADVRPGGRYRIRFRLTDGSEHEPTGIYRTVEPPRLLSFSWDWPGRPEWESLVTIRLRDTPGGTELTLTHDRLPEPARDSHVAGWSGLLDQLALFTEEPA